MAYAQLGVGGDGKFLLFYVPWGRSVVVFFEREGDPAAEPQDAVGGRGKGEGHCHLSMAETFGCSILCGLSSFVLTFSDIQDLFARLSVRHGRGKNLHLFRRGLKKIVFSVGNY